MPPHSPKPGEIGGNGLGNGTVTEKLLGNLKPWIEGKDVVDITEHTGGGVKHGAKTREEETKQAPKQ